jgi:hypothetical protein
MTLYDQAERAWRDLDYDKLLDLGVINKATHFMLEQAALLGAEMEALGEAGQDASHLERQHSMYWNKGSKAVERALKQLKKRALTAEDLIAQLKRAHARRLKTARSSWSLPDDLPTTDEDGEQVYPDWTSQDEQGLAKLLDQALDKYLDKALNKATADTFDKVFGDPDPWPDTGTFIGDVYYFVLDGQRGIQDLGDFYNTRSYGDDDNREEFELNLSEQLRDNILQALRSTSLDDPDKQDAFDRWLDDLRATRWD